MSLLALMLWPGDAGLLTRAGLVVLSVVATLLAARLVPRSWRPQGVVVTAAAVLVSFVLTRLSSESGLTNWLDHEVFERVGGATDDFPTWLVAGVAAAAVFWVDAARRRR